jgi:hypothetical protein
MAKRFEKNGNLDLKTCLKKNQTACGHFALKDGVCFGPHTRLAGTQKSLSLVVQIPLICTIKTPMSPGRSSHVTDGKPHIVIRSR